MGILAVVIGILGIGCSLFATFLFGTVGGIIAGVLGAAAIVLSYLKAKNTGKGGKVGLAIGALAITLAIMVTGIWSRAFTDLHNKALESKPDGLWAQVTEDANGGLMGIVKNLPEGEASLDALMNEMSELNVSVGK